MDGADFSGYATKAGLKCSDGRVITPEAFKHMDGVQVPLVWQHGHSSPDNVLGHAILQARSDGVYAYGFFNDTPQGINSRALVQHKDIKSLSIYANQLVEKSRQVLHGIIREVSLVLSGANPGALIDFVAVQHSDGSQDVLEDEAIIYTGLEFVEHAAGDAPDDGGPTMQDVYESLTDQQRDLVHYMIGAALGEATPSLAQSATTVEEPPATDPAAPVTPEPPSTDPSSAEGDLAHQEGTTTVTHNVFEQNGAPTDEKHVLTHDAVKGIVAAAREGGSLRKAIESYALAHGINDIDTLFPDAKMVQDSPEWNKRRTEWVAGVINGTRHNPFSRIKTMSADLTLDEARAKGYVKGSLKKEQFFGLLKRTTGPTTVYKKQKLDRDDILDITDFDVVAWLWTEMRFMLEEELAISILIGDGRAVDDDDKIKDPAGATDGTGIRSIANDDDLYAGTVYVNLDDASSSYLEFLDEITLTRRLYRGSGSPTLYTTEVHLGKLLTLRDGDNKRMFRSADELATELRVAAIVTVEAMEREPDIVGILVNLSDYAVGSDKGGEITRFDDFDIDYNQFKYLIETRLSGALTRLRSALVYRKVAAAAALVVPEEPDFADNVITPATTTGVTYKRADTNATVTTGAPITLDADTLPELTIYAIPASGSYYLENNVEDEWTFTYEA